MTIAVPPVQAEPIPPTASPNYFYNRETAFIVRYAFDNVNGGIFLAVAPDGSPIGSMAGEVIWGVPAGLFAGNPMQSTDKSLYGHATCIRYFIAEYQRITTLELQGHPALADLNAALVSVGAPTLASPAGLLTYAQSCADFVINNMVIAPDDSVDENSGGVDPWNYSDPGGGGGAPDRGDVVITNRVYYWSSVSEDATTRFVDDTLGFIASQPTAPRVESIVPWTMVELATALANAGVGGSATYRNHAIAWWNWRFTQADTLPDFNDPTPPAPDDVNACPVAAGGGQLNNCIAGGGRDLFIAPLGYALGGAFATQAITYADSFLGTGNAPNLPFPRVQAIQDSTYVAGFSRGALFANMQNNGVAVGTRDQYWDFGNNPARLITDWTNPATASDLTNLNLPFTHYNGREILAGTQRSLWFYYTFGENPNQTFPAVGTFDDEDDMRTAVLSMWDYINTNLWDTVDGQEAWFESTQRAYKPCFSAGTDLPIGDWAAPLIGNKVHTLNADGSATVSVTNVVDDDFAYLSWDFRGTGVADVEVVYTIDNGATWTVLPATTVGGNNYEATIPPQPDGTRVYYYARAVDAFLNRTAFPSGAEVWSDRGESITQSIANSQTYFIGDVVVAPSDEQNDNAVSVLVDDVTIAKSVFPPVARPGETVDWSITLSNMGSAPTGSLTITDTIPAGLTVISATSNTGTVTISGQQVTLTVASLPVGGQAVLTITTEIDDDVTASLLFNSVGDVSAQLIVVGGLPETGETPWWHPCHLIGRCDE
ncbi:MAG: DUF11 domain-containing protein [Chloroflexota bacterium]